MSRLFGSIFLVAASASSPLAAQVGTYELVRDRFEERPCEVSFERPSESLMVTLVQADGDWKLNFYLRNSPERFAGLFNAAGLRDDAKVERAVREITINDKRFPVDSVDLMVVQRSELDKGSVLIATISSLHNVAATMDALPSPWVWVGDLGMVSGVSDGMKAFKECSLAALDLGDGEIPPVDHVVQARLIFERGFDDWVELRSQIDGCSYGDSETEINQMIEDAASAFYPGLLNYSLRADWTKDMKFTASLARVKGLTSAASGQCLGGLVIVERTWRDVLQKGIEVASR